MTKDVLKATWWDRVASTRSANRDLIRWEPLANLQPPPPTPQYYAYDDYSKWLSSMWYPGIKLGLAWLGFTYQLKLEKGVSDSAYLQGEEASQETLYAWASFDNSLDKAAFTAFVWETIKGSLLHDAAEWFVVDGLVPFHPHLPQNMPGMPGAKK